MDTAFKQALKAKAHHLKPIIQVGGKGLTEAVSLETDNALKTHELIKVKIYGIEKPERIALATALCESVQAEIVQMIGSTAVIYRKNND
jgi:RNA-binding protein